jgi:hypothetical protein
MILSSLQVEADEFDRRTGWHIKPEGACKAEVCVPLPDSVHTAGGGLDVTVLADRLGMALVGADAVWALGPETAVTGRALTTAVAADLVWPDLEDEPFQLASLRGQKVVLVAWASWCGCRRI